MSQALSLLVIGYGNSLRRDDGAGLLLAQRLAKCWQTAGIPVRSIQTQQLMPELAEEMADAAITHVIFVDTRVAEDDAAAVDIGPLHPAVEEQQSLGHQMDPAMLLTYADRLFGHAPTTYVVTVPGVDFGFGDALSRVVVRVLDDAEGIGQQVLATISDRE